MIVRRASDNWRKILSTYFSDAPLLKMLGFKIGVAVPAWLRPERATRHIKWSLAVPFAMEIIILMCWCIWTARNDWLFNEEDPNLDNCKCHFKQEFAFALVILRAKPSRVQQMEAWLDGLNWCFPFFVLFCVLLKLLSLIKKISRGRPLQFFQKKSCLSVSWVSNSLTDSTLSLLCMHI
jgi:hypothetical protein